MIRAGMTIAEAILQLTKGFRKMMGRDPDGLEKIKIQQEAVKRLEDMNKVVDMQGRTLDPSKNVMGGTQEGAALKSGIMKATGTGPKKVVTKGLPDKEFQDLRRSFRMNIVKNSPDFNQDLADRIIKRELYQDLSDTQRKDFLDNLDFVLENPRGESKIRSMVEDAIDNASPGFVSGDRKYNAQLVAEDLAERKFGKEFYDLDQRQQMDLYDEALEGLSEQTRGMPDPEDFAQGGRAGFANGTGAPSIKYDFDKQQGPMGPVFETNKVEEAIKEIIRRRIPVDFANIPVTDRTGIMLGFDDIGIAGEKDLLGGELRFGGGKNFGTGEKKFGLEFRKKFNQGGRAGFF